MRIAAPITRAHRRILRVSATRVRVIARMHRVATISADFGFEGRLDSRHFRAQAMQHLS